MAVLFAPSATTIFQRGSAMYSTLHTYLISRPRWRTEVRHARLIRRETCPIGSHAHPQATHTESAVQVRASFSRTSLIISTFAMFYLAHRALTV